MVLTPHGKNCSRPGFRQEPFRSVDVGLNLLHCLGSEVCMINLLFCLLISITGQSPSAGGASTVDEAIDLYLMGDMNGSIESLENLLALQDLTLDERVRAYHRLGAAYFGIGDPSMTETAFYSLLLLDPYYDLGMWENPELKQILENVRQESMSTVLIQGEPQGALVFMEGEYVGSTPYIQDNLIGGQSYTFTIMAEGYETAVQSCATSPGQLHTMIYDMEPASEGTSMADLIPSDSGSVDQPQDIAQSDQTYGQVQPQDGGSGSLQPVADTSSVSSSGGGMTVDQLNMLLHGGEEMASLDNVGPLNSDLETASDESSGAVVRDHTLFENYGRTIETASESHARMVFSDVNLQQENVLQTDSGSTYSSRTSNEVREVLASKESAVTFIYNKHLRSDPLLAGTVVIEMIIEPSGRVSNVSILDSSTMNPAFDLELASAVETWRFGAVDEDEGSLPVTYPFNFSR
ncbi:MAG: TonB family protein [Candidatus Aegiribacteria sp.]|nr:TonB family protein [Candidatus Aegiribacteria sp.]MBD3294819.1 TonB family protein [Candidatus Fermentibacteria bacterium]